MSRIKIAMIGAGSSVFMRNLMNDVLQIPEISPVHVVLQDIDQTRLDQSVSILQTLIAMHKQVDMTFKSTNNQRDAIDGADFVIVCFQIGGYKPSTVIDFDIPKKYGLRQTIADSLGIGGIMRGLRTVPHLLSICKDMEETAPNAILLNHVNPMCINTWAIYKLAPKVRQVGLCHSIPLTHKLLAREAGLAAKDLYFNAAGINHMNFFLSLTHKQPDGSYVDIYPQLQAQYAQGKSPAFQDMRRCANKVRFEVMKHFGYFVTESSEHLSEYVPWFIKEGREDLIEAFSIPLDEYILRCEEQIEDWQNSAGVIDNTAHSEGIDDINLVHDNEEYTTQIIKAEVTNTPCVIYGNVENTDLISNLPNGACVEVPCVVDANGTQPVRVGNIPPHLAALMRTNINVQELVVEAIANEDKAHVYHAAMLDPHTAAELDLNQIRNMVDDLLVAHDDMLPKWLQK